MLAFLFLSVPACAQHCGYDFASIIVVRPHAAGDSAVIPGLRITLLDSNNVPVLHQGEPYHLFHRNERPFFCGYARKRDLDEHRPFFPFAKDNYVLVVPNGFRTETMRILVQDDDPGHYVDKRHTQWQNGWAQQVVPLDALVSYPLCGTHYEVVYPILEGRPPYHPVDVTLHRR